MTQAEICRAFLIYTWDGYDANEIAGRINPRDFDDAVEVARAMGAKIVQNVTGPGQGSQNHDYLFPDGSTATIILNDDGVGCGIEDILP